MLMLFKRNDIGKQIKKHVELLNTLRFCRCVYHEVDVLICIDLWTRITVGMKHTLKYPSVVVVPEDIDHEE